MLFTILPAVLLSLAATAEPAFPVEPNDGMPELTEVIKPRIYRDAAALVSPPAAEPRVALATRVPPAAPKGRL